MVLQCTCGLLGSACVHLKQTAVWSPSQLCAVTVPQPKLFRSLEKKISTHLLCELQYSLSGTDETLMGSWPPRPVSHSLRYELVICWTFFHMSV